MIPSKPKPAPVLPGAVQMCNRFVLLLLLVLAVICATACARTPHQKQTRYIERGKKLLAAKDYQRAILEFRNAVQLNLPDAEPYYQMALAKLAVRDFPGGISALRKAVELNPKHLAAQTKLAALMTTSPVKARLEEAASRMQQVLASFPGDSDALNVLAVAEFRLGKEKDAEAHLLEAFDGAPHSLAPAFNLVRLRLNKKDLPGAEVRRGGMAAVL